MRTARRNQGVLFLAGLIALALAIVLSWRFVSTPEAVDGHNEGWRSGGGGHEHGSIDSSESKVKLDQSLPGRTRVVPAEELDPREDTCHVAVTLHLVTGDGLGTYTGPVDMYLVLTRNDRRVGVLKHPRGPDARSGENGAVRFVGNLEPGQYECTVSTPAMTGTATFAVTHAGESLDVGTVRLVPIQIGLVVRFLGPSSKPLRPASGVTVQILGRGERSVPLLDWSCQPRAALAPLQSAWFPKGGGPEFIISLDEAAQETEQLWLGARLMYRLPSDDETASPRAGLVHVRIPANQRRAALTTRAVLDVDMPAQRKLLIMGPEDGKQAVPVLPVIRREDGRGPDDIVPCFLDRKRFDSLPFDARRFVNGVLATPGRWVLCNPTEPDIIMGTFEVSEDRLAETMRIRVDSANTAVVVSD